MKKEFSSWRVGAVAIFGKSGTSGRETSPGPAVPTPNSLKKFIPVNHLWPIDEVWNFHTGSARFKNLEIYNSALNAEYGAPADLDDYNRKSQAMAYDGERA